MIVILPVYYRDRPIRDEGVNTDHIIRTIPEGAKTLLILSGDNEVSVNLPHRQVVNKINEAIRVQNTPVMA